MHIGLVEESLKLGEVLKEELEQSKHQVIIYEGVQEAKSAILKTRFHNTPLPCDLLILDQDQEGNAVTMIRRLRLFLSSEQLPIILISNPSPEQHILISNPSPEQHILSQELDILILNRPITPTDLLAAIAAIPKEIAAD